LVPVLESLGWSPFFAEAFAPHGGQGLAPGRVTREHRGLFRVQAEAGEYVAELAGRLRHEARGRADLPAVGDWVALLPAQGLRATIMAVLPRRSRFARKTAGDEHDQQVAAANVDTVFLVSGLDHDFNLRRIERYLVMARESGARPVVVLNKADLSADAEHARREVERVAGGAPVHLVSVREGTGLEELEPYLRPRETVALLGSSGVGKSTLLNRLSGTERQATRAVRAHDSRGRHTTSHRQIFVLPTGALMVDTPGMRELQLWDAGAGLDATFDDVEALAASCRFGDCAHGAEPGCAVREALAQGRLDPARLASYEKLRAEGTRLEHEQDKRARSEANRKVRALHRSARKHHPRG
jgi:ribosome biogenesis GTPase